MMQKIILISLAALLFIIPAFGQSSFSQESSGEINPGEIQIQFNKNIELLGLVYFIAWLGEEIESDEAMLDYGGRQIQGKEWYAYGYALYQKYKAHRESEVLAGLYDIAGNIGTDYFVALFVQLEDFPNAKLTGDIEERHFIEFSPNKDVAEARENVTVLIDIMNRFYQEVDFDAYLSSSAAYYEQALLQVKYTLPASDGLIPAMESFYQQQFDQYTLLPSLTIPAGSGFGVQYTSNKQTKIYNVFGPLTLQKFKDTNQPDMGFGDEKRLRELTIHEFGHSFVNPVIDKIPQYFIDESSPLYKPIKSVMEDQGYIEWKYCLDEHFVRAGEVIIARNLGHTKEAEELEAHYINDRKFLYLPLIIEELENYNQNKKKITYEEVVGKALEKLRIMATKR